MSGKVEQLKDEGTRRQVLTAGAIAGLISRFVVAPLDVVKIRLQLQIHSLSDPLSVASAQGGPTYKGTLSTFKHIVREEGITGLWKGNVPAEAMYLCYGGVQFLSYRTASSFLANIPPPFTPPDAAVSFLAGATAGTFATTATYPLDLLRTRFAAQGSERVYISLAASVHDIYASEGPLGFFRGLGAGVSQIVPYMGLFFLSYEMLKPAFAPLPLPFGSTDAAAGITASVFSKTAVFPLDTVRKRLQVQGPTRAKYIHKNIPVYEGVYRTIRQILRREGPRGLYRGLTVSLIKAAPTSAVTMWTYERVMALLMSMDEKMEMEE